MINKYMNTLIPLYKCTLDIPRFIFLQKARKRHRIARS